MAYSDSFTENAISQQALAQYINATNSVAQYLNEILPRVQWDLLPSDDFLYEGYKTWYKKVSPSGRVCGRNDFYDSVKQHLNDNAAVAAQWEWTSSCRSKGRIDCSVKEPLIVELDLKNFINPLLNIGNPLREYPDARKVKTKYSGLKRIMTFVQVTNLTDEEKD